MSSFDWLEFETLSREIADLEDRLAGAKSTKNHGLMRLLDHQLGDAKHRRERALEAITRHTASSAAAPAPRTRRAAVAGPPFVDDAPAAPAAQREAELEAIPADGDAAATALESFADPMEGASIVWDQLTPDHIEQAKRELGRRRAEILARHAEELRALDTDQDEIDTLDRAIEAFARKFSQRADAGGEVVPLARSATSG